MIKEYEQNKAYAEKLATLMANHPDMRVMAWIDTDGIDDDYSCMAGYIYEPRIETLIIGKDDMYHEKEDSPYDDCCHYYGWEEVDEWSDEKIEEKSKQIPWEDVIAVRFAHKIEEQEQTIEELTLEQEPREITLEDVEEYCKPRRLTIITDELLYELTHPKI